jgi:hypothetical protein
MLQAYLSATRPSLVLEEGGVMAVGAELLGWLGTFLFGYAAAWTLVGLGIRLF